MEKFTVGLTRDLLTSSGDPSFGREALRILDAEPNITWEIMPESVNELTPAMLSRYDGILVNAPRVSRASFGNGAVRTRILARHGVGYDSVDVPACTEHGVVLTNQPDGVRRPVAVAALTFIMALSQHLFTKDRLTRAGRWNERTDYMGMGLIGRTLGIVGAGSIGREIMRLAKPFGLRLLAADPYANAEAVAAEGAELTDLATVMRESDFVVVVCLLTPETHHLIGAEQFALMKPTAYFINVARGPIMDEVAAQALEISTRANNMAVGVTPGPPNSSGRFRPITPNSASLGTWQVTEASCSSSSWARGAISACANLATASARAWSSSVTPRRKKVVMAGPW